MLSLGEQVQAGTDHYIDDIIANQNNVSATEVRVHFKADGLETKEPEPVSDARVLGLNVFPDAGGPLRWKRDNASAESSSVSG